ncbi:sugar ABC transporter permease [Sorangium cellulosum]|uniref:Sugar ABC transporter permease n=1 Tax=Sorangium cellulosum TaxID=56 RepID=A0A2L0F883_SORCE|nr:ABC transporter permease [Sorangium cellulosum]AUX47727.1 sugar ABC transporter permease [Sorangium cellulosum]
MSAPGSRLARLREELTRLLHALRLPVLSVFTAMVVGGVLIALSGGNPLEAYAGMAEGAFGSPRAVSETFVWSTPYILAGLSVTLAFRGGLFNIGAEGQLALGALAAAWAGHFLPRLLGVGLPALLHVPATLLAGALAGGLWGAAPGWIKARSGGHEVISTIMLNYVALNAVSFLLNGPMKDASPGNVLSRTPLIDEGARLPALVEGFRLHWGFPLALLAAALVGWVLRRTAFGFEIRTSGQNPDAARYAGVRVGRTVILTMALSGALAGVAGAIEVSALHHRHELGFSQGYGFDAIAIALLGKAHPGGTVLAAFLFSAMRSGATRMQYLTQIPIDVISVIQALILLFVAADTLVRRIYRIRGERERLVLTRGWGG